MISKNKKLFLGLLLGALLFAGLFFVKGRKATPEKISQLKPSQLDFTQGNQIQEAKPVGPAVKTEIPQKVEQVGSLAGEDQKKWKSFIEILRSKNDNDPRIDQELKDLSPEMHLKLREAYQTLPKEDRNGRGLVAFLISRDLKTVEDAEFLKTIYQESPCLGFQNCETEMQEEPHLSSINQTSLNYPQVAGLYQLERRLGSQADLLKDPEMRKQISEILREARQFPADSVQKKAEKIQKQYGL